MVMQQVEGLGQPKIDLGQGVGPVFEAGQVGAAVRDAAQADHRHAEAGGGADDGAVKKPEMVGVVRGSGGNRSGSTVVEWVVGGETCSVGWDEPLGGHMLMLTCCGSDACVDLDSMSNVELSQVWSQRSQVFRALPACIVCCLGMRVRMHASAQACTAHAHTHHNACITACWCRCDTRPRWLVTTC